MQPLGPVLVSIILRRSRNRVCWARFEPDFEYGEGGARIAIVSSSSHHLTASRSFDGEDIFKESSMVASRITRLRAVELTTSPTHTRASPSRKVAPGCPQITVKNVDSAGALLTFRSCNVHILRVISPL